MMSARAQKFNLVVFMITSFLCYQGAQRGGGWLGLGPGMLIIHIALFLPVTPQKAIRMMIALMTGITGFFLETALIAANVYTVLEPSRWLLVAPLCPEWILVLWLNFGFMLYLYREFLNQARWIPSLIGAVFSFMIMGNASRMGLIIFDEHMMRSYLIIAVCWAGIVSLQVYLSNRLAQSGETNDGKQG